MPRSEQRVQASEIARIKKAIKDLQSGRLSNASMHGSRVIVYDDDGDVREVIGNQGDGSYGSRVIKSPPQPTTTAPVVPVASEEERVPNVFPVEWDGGIVQGSVPVVHGRVDAWTQRADSVGEWDPELAKLAGSIRDQQGGATSVVVEGSGTYLVAFQMVGADRVTKGDFSEPSVVEVSARVDAEDIEDRLNAFADGELPDGAYDNLMARLAEFLHVRADQIDVNSLAADSAFISLLETAGIVLSDEAAGRRTEVSGQGLRITDSDTGNVQTQIGTFTDDLISLHDRDTGEPTISMGQDGGIGAHHLSVSSDPVFGGKRLAGSTFESPRWHGANNIFGMTGGHVVAHHRRSFDWESTGNSTNGQSIAHLETRLDPGRLYRVQCHDFEMNDRRPYFIEAFYTTSNDPDVRPDPPNRFSLTWGASPARVPQSGEGHGSKLTFDRVVSFNTARRIRINFVVGVNGGTGTLDFGGLQRHAAHFTVTDVGPNLGPSGQDLWQGAGASTGNVPEPQESLFQNYDVAQTATYILDRSTGIAHRQWTNQDMRFGSWPDGETYLTVLRFADWDQPGTPTQASVGMRVGSWVSAAGSIVQCSIPDFTGTPESFDFDGEDVLHLDAERGVPRSDVTRPSLEHETQMDLAGRSHASIILGGRGWTSSPRPASGKATTNAVTATLTTDLSEQGEGDDDEDSDD